MLHPVGSRTPSVYWRRRLLMLAAVVALVILVVLTGKALLASGAEQPAGAGGGSGTSITGATAPTSGSPGGTASTPAGSGPGTGAAGTTAAGSGTGTSSAALPGPCTPAQLQVKALVGKQRYAVGDEPQVMLQVTNTGPKPCVQDVADSQIELRVYNGASRVWGSHDCQVVPGVDKRTLDVNRPAAFVVQWSGLTSQPKCVGTRQRVGAGTYTLYAALSGHEGTTAQFVIS
jgi:hypothetical protein